jgi:predicted RecB family endonuclease
MIQVTKNNVTKMSEDALYLTLEQLPASSDLYVIIEAELDRRIECNERLLKKQQEVKLESLKLTLAMQSEIFEIFKGF